MSPSEPAEPGAETPGKKSTKLSYSPSSGRRVLSKKPDWGNLPFRHRYHGIFQICIWELVAGRSSPPPRVGSRYLSLEIIEIHWKTNGNQLKSLRKPCLKNRRSLQNWRSVALSEFSVREVIWLAAKTSLSVRYQKMCEVVFWCFLCIRRIHV